MSASDIAIILYGIVLAGGFVGAVWLIDRDIK